MYVNGQMRPVETIPGMGGWGIKKKDEGYESKYDKCHNILQYNNDNKNKS
jgi:hypothetical protein